MELLLKLKDLDRRIIFLFVAAAIALPMLIPFQFGIIPGDHVLGIHKFIENLPKGTRAWVSFDFDPASMPELHPAAIAVLVHMMRKGVKPICGALWPVGGDMAEGALASATDIIRTSGKPTDQEIGANLKYGRDYVNLGYKPGAAIHIKRMIAGFLDPYPTDKTGIPTSEMEIFKNTVKEKFSMADIGIIVSFTAGTGGIEAYISVAGEHKRPMAAGCTSVNIPRFYTYVQTKQLVGMTGGMPGAAEYEKTQDYVGSASKGMNPQSVCHLIIILFIILGNLASMAEKSKQARKA